MVALLGKRYLKRHGCDGEIISSYQIDKTVVTKRRI